VTAFVASKRKGLAVAAWSTRHLANAVNDAGGEHHVVRSIEDVQALEL
jgi:hypothetical protein